MAGLTRSSRQRRRDRHGRGFRRDVIPPHLPGFRTRRDLFDQAVTDAMGPLYRAYPRELDHVEILVEDVPAERDLHSRHIVLGQYFPGDRLAPPRIVVYRRPIESRATDRDELGDMVYRVIVENVALALGIRPGEIDPSL